MTVHIRGIGILIGCVVAVTVLANTFVDHLMRIG